MVFRVQWYSQRNAKPRVFYGSNQAMKMAPHPRNALGLNIPLMHILGLFSQFMWMGIAMDASLPASSGAGLPEPLRPSWEHRKCVWGKSYGSNKRFELLPGRFNLPKGVKPPGRFRQPHRHLCRVPQASQTVKPQVHHNYQLVTHTGN